MIVRAASIAGEVRRFLAEQAVDPTGASSDPFADGLVDSLALEQVLAFVLERYGVDLDADVGPDGFPSVRALADLVAIRRDNP